MPARLPLLLKAPLPTSSTSKITKRAKMFKFDYVLTVVQIAGLNTYSVHTKNCLAHW